MDIFYMIGGAFLGGLIAAALSGTIPDLPIALRSLISMIGFFGGVAGGYVMAWAAKRNAEIERLRSEAEGPPPQPRKPQIVGSKCSNCGIGIMFIIDAQICTTCNLVVCKTCDPAIPCSKCRLEK